MTTINYEIDNEIYADFKIKLAQEEKRQNKVITIKDKITQLILDYNNSKVKE